jgi:hypothetical protein
VKVIDDSLYEEDERFHVILMEPMGGRIKGQNWTTVVIEPVIIIELYLCIGQSINHDNALYISNYYINITFL